MIFDVRAQHHVVDFSKCSLHGAELFHDVDTVNVRVVEHSQHTLEVPLRTFEPQGSCLARFGI